MTGLSNRMQRMIRLAEEEAAEIRARANAEAEKVKAGAASHRRGDQRAERETFDAERERTRRQLADQVRDLLAEATARGRGDPRAAQQESQAMLAAATAESERLVFEAIPSRPAATLDRRPRRGDGDADRRPRRVDRHADVRPAPRRRHTLTSAREEAEALTARVRRRAGNGWTPRATNAAGPSTRTSRSRSAPAAPRRTSG